MLGTLRHLMVYVSDLTRSRSFYDAVLGHLGYTVAHGSDSYAMWVPDGGGCAVGIVQSEGTLRAHPHERGAPGWHHLALNADVPTSCIARSSCPSARPCSTRPPSARSTVPPTTPAISKIPTA